MIVYLYDVLYNYRTKSNKLMRVKIKFNNVLHGYFILNVLQINLTMFCTDILFWMFLYLLINTQI